MKLLDRRPLDIIIALSDNEGYVVSELAEKLDENVSNISTYLNKLQRESIVIRQPDLAKKEERGLRRTGDFYYIGPKDSASSEEKLNVFQLILKSLVEPRSDTRWKLTLQESLPLQEKLLASIYVNSLITTCGLKDFYKIIENYMERNEFRKLASRALLIQPALIKEYVKLSTSMREAIGSDKERIQNPVFYLRNNKHLELLFKFNALESVKFHRQYLGESFAKLYRDLSDMDDAQSSNPIITEGIKKFLELDLILSPATSFPQNHPVNLLFAKPFERLYNDVYICNASDYEIMVRRAYLIYSNFAEILKVGILSVRREENDSENMDYFLSRAEKGLMKTRKFNFIGSLRRDLFNNSKNINNLIKGLIFYWNVESLRLDYLYCKERYSRKRWLRPSVGYHILANSDGVQAIEFDENLKRGALGLSRYGLIVTSLWSGDSDPFSNLRYCCCFKDLNLQEKQVSVEEIAAVLADIYSD